MGSGIFGVGPGELVVILIIMLVVAGPKRMIAWAYMLGKYTAQLRAMFQETMNAFQKEIDAAGVKELGKDLPNLKGIDILNEASKILYNEPAASAEQKPPQANTPTLEPKPDDEKPRYDSWTPS